MKMKNFFHWKTLLELYIYQTVQSIESTFHKIVDSLGGSSSLRGTGRKYYFLSKTSIINKAQCPFASLEKSQMDL